MLLLLWTPTSAPEPLLTPGPGLTAALPSHPSFPPADIMCRPPRNAHTDHLVNLKLLLFTYLHIGVMQVRGCGVAWRGGGLAGWGVRWRIVWVTL